MTWLLIPMQQTIKCMTTWGRGKRNCEKGSSFPITGSGWLKIKLHFFFFLSAEKETYAHPNYTFERAVETDLTSLWYSFNICISNMRWPRPDSPNWYSQELSFSLGMTENKGTYKYGLLSLSTEI